MANKYTILSNYAAPERDISTHTFEEFIDISWLDESSLKDWFADYRYDAEVEQGESYYNQSIEKESEQDSNKGKSGNQEKTQREKLEVGKREGGKKGMRQPGRERGAGA